MHFARFYGHLDELHSTWTRGQAWGLYGFALSEQKLVYSISFVVTACLPSVRKYRLPAIPGRCSSYGNILPR